MAGKGCAHEPVNNKISSSNEYHKADRRGTRVDSD